MVTLLVALLVSGGGIVGRGQGEDRAIDGKVWSWVLDMIGYIGERAKVS